MWIKNSALLLLVVIIFSSCDKKRVFDEYKSVGSAWNKDTTVTFNLPQLDSTKRYNLFVNLRANNNYKYNNLFLIVALELPNGFTKVDTLLGDGFSDIKESKLFYKENVRFRSTYKVHIKQAVRESGKVPGVKALDGITEVGFRIEKKE